MYQAGLQRSLLIDSPPDPEDFIRDLVDDVESGRTRVSFISRGTAFETFIAQSQTDYAKRFTAAIQKRPPIYGTMEEFDHTSTADPIARFTDINRLYSFVGQMSGEECSAFTIQRWPGFVPMRIAFPMSPLLDDDRRMAINHAIDERRAFAESRAIVKMEPECRRHFFPEEQSAQLSFKAIDWYTMNALFFALFVIGMFGGIVVGLETLYFNKTRTTVEQNIGSVVKTEVLHTIYVTTYSKEDEQVLANCIASLTVKFEKKLTRSYIKHHSLI